MSYDYNILERVSPDNYRILNLVNLDVSNCGWTIHTGEYYGVFYDGNDMPLAPVRMTTDGEYTSVTRNNYTRTYQLFYVGDDRSTPWYGEVRGVNGNYQGQEYIYYPTNDGALYNALEGYSESANLIYVSPDLDLFSCPDFPDYDGGNTEVTEG